MKSLRRLLGLGMQRVIFSVVKVLWVVLIRALGQHQDVLVEKLSLVSLNSYQLFDGV